MRFHLLCIGSCAFLYFALSPKWLLRRHASETPIYVSSALLPACTQYSRPELATQGITVVALVTDFEVTCAYPMPDE